MYIYLEHIKDDIKFATLYCFCSKSVRLVLQNFADLCKIIINN